MNELTKARTRCAIYTRKSSDEGLEQEYNSLDAQRDACEGGDKLMVPANTAALGSDMTGTAPDGAGRPTGGTLPEPGVATSGDPDPQLDPQGEL